MRISKTKLSFAPTTYIIFLIVIAIMYGAILSIPDSRGGLAQAFASQGNAKLTVKASTLLEVDSVTQNRGLSSGDFRNAAKESRGCYTLFYDCNVYYSFKIPDAYSDDYFNMRFTPQSSCTLKTAMLAFYHPQCVDSTGQGINVLVWADDGSGLPGTLLATVNVPASSMVYYPSFVTVDFSVYNLVFTGDFHIGYTTVNQAAGNIYAILSDDASCGTQRSSEYYNGGWGTMLNDWGVDVNFLIRATVCGPTSTPFTISQVHDSAFAWNDGRQFHVTGWFTDNEEKKLVADYYDHLKNEVMPAKSVLFLTGDTLPTADISGQVILKGYIDSIRINPYPYYPEVDTLLIYYHVTEDSLLKAGDFPKDLNQQGIDNNLDQLPPEDLLPVSCKFAVLIAGGVDANNNHVRYRNLLSTYYAHLRTVGYDEANIQVIYYDGATNLPAGVPIGRIKSATNANITTAFNNVAAAIAGCGGNKVRLFLLSYDHGSSNGNICLLGNNGLTPVGLKNNVQTVLNAGCDTLYMVMAQCFGGIPALELKNADIKNRTTMFVISEANTNVVGFSTGTGNPFLEKMHSELDLGRRFEVAMVAAAKAYYNYLLTLSPTASVLAARAARSILWRRDYMGHGLSGCYGHSAYESSFQSGKFEFLFAGQPTACGNSVLYERRPKLFGWKWVRVAIWNWNVPGSGYYVPGNELRIYNVSASSSEIFEFVGHCTNPYRITASSMADRTQHWKAPQEDSTSPSNIGEFAGFGVGWADTSAEEFESIVQPSLNVTGVNLDEFDLSTLPQILGPSGVTVLRASYSIPEYNPYWRDIELILDVAQVLTPGTLQVSIEPGGALQKSLPLYIDTVGRYRLRIGEISHDTLQTIELDATNANFTVDSWALNTLVPTYPFLCGDANLSNSVNALDITFLINYLYKGGSKPFPLRIADVNHSGTINALDITYLINYLYKHGNAPNCP